MRQKHGVGPGHTVGDCNGSDWLFVENHMWLKAGYRKGNTQYLTFILSLTYSVLKGGYLGCLSV